MDLTTAAQLVVSGLTIGCVYSLVGLGFALTLKATELINFAQGEMVMLGAFFGLSLLRLGGLPYWLVFLIAMAATGAVGVAIERVVLRPILARKAPLLNLLIATLGLSIALPAIAVVIWGRDPVAYPALFSDAPVSLFGLHVQALNLWILGLGFAAMAGLQFFFQRTLVGIGWRAASLDPATAALYGVSRNRNVALTFGLSAALGGAAGVLMAPLFFASVGLGHSVLIKAFAAAAIGGFGVVGTMVGGIVVGVIETLAAGGVSSEYKNVITYAILIAILMFFFRPRMPAGRSITETSRVALGRSVAALQHPALKVGLAAAVIALWAALFLLADAYALRVINLALIFAIAVLGLQVIVGLTGQFSFGHAAFLGIGAYTSALLTAKLGWPFWLGVPAATLAAGLGGLLLAPILRLSGHFLAIATLAAGEIAFLLMLNWKWLTNGAYGLYGIPVPAFGDFELDSDASFFVLISLVLAAVYWAVERLVHSRFGRSLIAVRENELAALACGISANQQKVKAFVIGSACAGLAGGLYAHYLAYISPENFTFVASVQMVTMVVIGGLGSMAGGIVGSVLVTLLPEYLRFLSEFRLVVYGALIVAFMMFLPGGMAEIGRRLSRLLLPARPAR